MRTILHLHTTSTSTTTTLAPEVAVGVVIEVETPPGSPWHSPMPYLFGGLAAMLGIIAFALLILACSFWRRTHHQGEEESPDTSQNGGGNSKKMKGSPVFEEDKFVVIMAGDDKPTFLATPSIIFSITKHGSCNETSSAIHVDDNDPKQQQVLHP